MIDTVIGIGWGLIIAMILHAFIPCTEQRECKENAIQYRAAYYHPDTGEFKWKDLNETLVR